MLLLKAQMLWLSFLKLLISTQITWSSFEHYFDEWRKYDCIYDLCIYDPEN